MDSPATTALTAFRLGDIRGRYPDEIDESFVYRFARAFVAQFAIEGTVATGQDMRSSSASLHGALNEGLQSSGVDVIDMGLCPTELGYYASTRAGITAAIVVTASHNPPAYNGLKCVLAGGEAVTFDTGLSGVMERMQTAGDGARASRPGRCREADLDDDYIAFLASRFDLDALDVGNVALNGLNGTAATLAVNIANNFNLPATWFRREPGPIPDEGADPAKPRLVAEMKEFMADRDFSLGVCWDGDCDRCVFFDGHGNLVPTYYVIGLLAEHFLTDNPGRAIVFDTKLCWNTLDVIEAGGGIAIPSETGHAFVKRHMRRHNAIYGGELSSHHFFGDFYYCDSGMFAWLKIMEVIARGGRRIDELVADRRKRVCSTPEINLSLSDADAAFTEIAHRYGGRASIASDFDGPGFEMPDGWRFTLRRSKTEPLVRVNFESRGEPDMLCERAAEVLAVLAPFEDQATAHDDQIYVQ